MLVRKFRKSKPKRIDNKTYSDGPYRHRFREPALGCKQASKLESEQTSKPKGY